MAAVNRSPVTMLGLGTVGIPIAEAFLAAGHPTTVWNRSPSKADAVVAKGARRAATVVDAVSASPLVVVCVSNYDAANELLASAGGALAGRVLVNLTTGTPAEARDMAAWAAAHGADYLDGAIMAVPQTIGLPQAVLLYSGSTPAFQAHDLALGSLGTSRYLGADPATAALYDIGLLDAMYAMYAGFFHSVALVGTAKIDAVPFTSVLVGWLTAILDLLPGFAAEIDTGAYPNRVSGLELNRDAVANVRQVSQDQGMTVDVLGAFQALMDQRVRNGHGTDSLSSVIEAFRS